MRCGSFSVLSSVIGGALCAVLLSSSTAAAAPKKLDVPANLLRKVGKVSCFAKTSGDSTKWVPGTVKKDGYFYPSSGAKKKKDRKKCRELQGESVTSLALNSLPAASDVVLAKASRNSNAAVQSDRIEVRSSGAPKVSEVAENTLKYFFDSKIEQLISGELQDQNACQSLFPDFQKAGTPSGQPGCYQLQEAMHVASIPAESGGSRCYMQQLAREELLGKGVSVVSGELPAGGINSLFVPGDTTRIIQFNVTNFPGEEDDRNQRILISVYPQGTGGNDYLLDLRFCLPEGTASESFERMSVKDGVFTTLAMNRFSDGASYSEVSGAVEQDSATGRYRFVTSGTNSATVAFFGEDQGPQGGSHGYRASIEVTSSEGRLSRFKVRSISRHSDGSSRKAFSVSDVSYGGANAGLGDLVFHGGAFTDEFTHPEFEDHAAILASEFSNGKYRVSSNEELLGLVEEEDLLSHEVYSLGAPQDDSFIDTSDYSCDLTPTVVVELDFSKDALQKVAQKCEQYHDGAKDMCRSEELSQAESNFFQMCMGGEEFGPEPE